MDRDWDEWMHDYAHGALVLLPPRDVGAACDELRARHDPRSAAICQSHVTLSEPLPRPLTDGDADELSGALARLEPFDLTYGPLRGYRPIPGIALEITPEASFRALRDAVHATALFDGVTLTRDHVPPHLTIAEFVTLDEGDRLVDALAATAPRGTFRCDQVTLVTPDEAFHFRPARSFSIGTTRP